MASRLEKTITAVSDLAIVRDEASSRFDPRCLLLTTLAYLCVMLSVDVVRIDTLLWFGLYPVVAAPLVGKSFGSIFLRSLWVLPLVVLIGLVNPFVDRAPVFTVCRVVLTQGWLSFAGIILRGLLSMQALLILLSGAGFIGMVRGMRRLGMPAFMTTQLLMVFRYLSVLMQEALAMHRAREARGFGRKRFPLRMWGTMIGQLFIRSVERSERIGRAMLARGFDGSIPAFSSYDSRFRSRDWIFLSGWTALFMVLRFVNLSSLFIQP